MLRSVEMEGDLLCSVMMAILSTVMDALADVKSRTVGIVEVAPLMVKTHV